MDKKLKSLIVTTFAHFSNDSVFLVYPLLITYYTLIPGLNLVLLGTLAIVYQLIYGAVSTPIGMIADRSKNEGFMVAVGIAILGISMLAFAGSFAIAALRMPLIIAGVLLLGAGTAFYHPIGASILKGIYGKKAASMMGINGSAGSFGRSVMPIILVFLITALGTSFALGLVGIELLIASGIVYVGLMSFNKSIRAGFWGLHGLKRNRKTATAKVSIFKSGYADVLLPLVAVIFVRSMFMTGTYTFIPEYLKVVMHSEVLVGTILSVSFVFAIFGQLFFGYVTSKKGGRYTITATAFVSAISFVLFLLAGNNIYFALAMLSIFIFVTFNGFAVILGYVNQLVPDKIANSSNAFTWGIGQIFGGAAGVGVMTLLLNYTSVTNAMWYISIFMFISIFMLPLLYRKGRKNRKQNGKGSKKKLKI